MIDRASTATTLRLATLAAAAFVYVTAEMLPVGLLTEISSDLAVTEGRVGLLLTFYAYGVAALTLPLISAIKTWPRRRVVVLTVAVLAVSQLVAALAVNYPMLVAARLLCAGTHGVFWAVVAPVAAALVPRAQQGKAIATVYAGMSLALVLGGPLSSAIGQSWGWRTAPAAIGLAAVLIALALHRALPTMPVDAGESSAVNKPRQTPAMRRALAVICTATLLAALGHFAAYTYFTLLVEQSLGSSGTVRTMMLLLYGTAGALGVWAAAKFYDRRARLFTLSSIATVAGALAVFWLLAPSVGFFAVLATILWGAAYTTIPICLQSSVLRAVPIGTDQASAVYVVVFQVAIATGALLGAGIVDNGGLTYIAGIGAAVMLGAFGVVLVGRRGFPREQERTPHSPDPVVADRSN
ncbi:putative MFS family arabinose efflux permease [Rhodococcus sp. 27YEA15]|uniref:MFS transporter n=1 Tax=Rhodococcus sp. 27YEA15 TaxID=3156259 RepID=UPI003C7E2ECC